MYKVLAIIGNPRQGGNRAVKNKRKTGEKVGAKRG